MEDILYLDNNATTPVDPRVLEAMLPYFTELYANAASSHHFGQKVNRDVQKARQTIADFLGAFPKEIIFTSGATEAINLAMKGLAAYATDRRHIVTVSTEHKAVLDTAAYLEEIGFEVTYLPVQRDGLLDLSVVEAAIRPDTLLVSVMYVNNETGVIQDIKKMGELAHEKGAIFMSDATQAVGKIPVDVDDLGIDLMPFSAHKFYGPKGIGGLFVRTRPEKKIRLQPLIHGGGHEQGLRSGTLNVPLIIGLAKTCEIANEEMEVNSSELAAIKNKLEKQILKITGSWVNGSKNMRLYNIMNVGIEGLNAGLFVQRVNTIALSTGSACTSAVIEPSHVLQAMGLTTELSISCFRISISKSFTRLNADSLIKILSQLKTLPTNTS